MARYVEFTASLTPAAVAYDEHYSAGDIWDFITNRPLVAAHKPPCDVIEKLSLEANLVGTGVMVFGQDSSLFKVRLLILSQLFPIIKSKR